MRPERLLRLQLQHEVLELVEPVECRHRPGERTSGRPVDPTDAWPQAARAKPLQEAELHQHPVDGAAGENDRYVAVYDAGPCHSTLSPSISSIRESVASSSSTPTAPTLSSTCSGRDAPMIADATFGSRSTHASASCASVIPSSSAIGCSCCTRSRSVWLRARPMNWPIESEVARVPSGSGSPGLYFPVKTPCASGDQTICEMPLAFEAGMTSRSGPRQSIEYCGWLETNFSTPGSCAASSILSAGHSLKPSQRALPARTTSVSASIVSSSGVSQS